MRLNLLVVIRLRRREDRIAVTTRTGTDRRLIGRRTIGCGFLHVLVVKEDAQDANVGQREEEGDAGEMRILLHEKICTISQIEVEQNKCVFHTAKRRTTMCVRVRVKK